MKNCPKCKHANWKRNAAGKLHPSGEGGCAYPFNMPVPPGMFYWPGGGFINRHIDKDNKAHCPYGPPLSDKHAGETK